MNSKDKGERLVAWALLILCPLSMVALFCYVAYGNAPGIAAGHQSEYILTMCIIWGAVMTALPVLRLLRLVSLPYWFMAIIYANVYLFPVALSQGWYLDNDWWANSTHMVSSVVVTSISFLALCLMEARSPKHVSFGSACGLLPVLIMVAFAFGVMWELIEGLVDALTGIDYMSYGALHTMGNLCADVGGAFIMVFIAWIILRKHSVEEIASTVRLGKRSFL